MKQDYMSYWQKTPFNILKNLNFIDLLEPIIPLLMTLTGINSLMFRTHICIVNSTYEVERRHTSDGELCTIVIALLRLSSYCWRYLEMWSLIPALKEVIITLLKHYVLIMLKLWDGIKMASAARPVWQYSITNVRKWAKMSCPTAGEKGPGFALLVCLSFLIASLTICPLQRPTI